jgi:hypothetical protein
MSCDICFALSHAPCDRLFCLLRVIYLASPDVNLTLMLRILVVLRLPAMLVLATVVRISVSLDLNVLIRDGEHFSLHP